jgi:hypothetical protein
LLGTSIGIVESLILRGLFLKEWMRLERFRKFQLDSQHVLGCVGIRFSTLIATNREAFTEGRGEELQHRSQRGGFYA